MVHSSDPFVCSPLPPMGSVAATKLRGPAVPHLHRYYGLIRFLTAHHQLSLVALDRQLPCLGGSGDCEAFPSSWRIPLKTCRGLETPAARYHLAYR